MPEAPEVERVMRALKTVVQDGVIDRYRSLHHCFRDDLPRMRVRSVHRHGKWMVLSDHRVAVMINLGMSGGFTVGGPVRRNARWIAIVSRDDGTRTLLQFVDPRCMGRLRVLDARQTRQIMRGNACTVGCLEMGLGPDAMCNALRDGDVMRTTARWRTMLSTALPLKRALMAQHVVAGLGNIYAAEACWRAAASPFRPARELTLRQLRALATETPIMLHAAFRLGGTSIGDANSFRGMDEREGRARVLLRVYGREGRPCARCGAIIRRDQQGGRSTFWCRACQT